MRGGRTLYGDTKLLDEEALFGKDCEAIEVCGRAKKACVKKDVDKYTLDQVKFEGEKFAPLFECKGKTPPNEPTCVPSRGTTASAPNASVYGGITASDKDGDGVPDSSDNCPTIFNPIRPMDGDTQADGDGDGIGDACDKCPNTSNDVDGTGGLCDPGGSTFPDFDGEEALDPGGQEFARPDGPDGDGIPNGSEIFTRSEISTETAGIRASRSTWERNRRAGASGSLASG
jgi:hypothetical protein